MIKTDSPAIQAVYNDDEINVPTERRIMLAEKSQRLYGKYCGTKGRGICAESFAEYHIWRGELIVARDFLIFLNAQAERFRHMSPCTAEIEAQLAMTEGLIERIRGHLGE